MLDHVPLGLGGAPAGRDGHHVALPERVARVVNQVGLGLVEVLKKFGFKVFRGEKQKGSWEKGRGVYNE